MLFRSNESRDRLATKILYCVRDELLARAKARFGVTTVTGERLIEQSVRYGLAGEPVANRTHFTRRVLQKLAFLLIDRARSNQPRTVHFSQLSSGIESASPDTWLAADDRTFLEELEREETHTWLRRALDNLTPVQRQLLVMRVCDDRKLEDIARELNRATSGVCTIINATLTRLQAELCE